MARIFHPLNRDELSELRRTFTLLDLPVRVDMDGDTAVLRMPDTIATHAEARALIETARRTDGYRREVD
jgi:hypothetical protein